MSNLDDDPEFRTPEERAEDEAYQRRLIELVQMDDDLDDHQAALERLADEDPMGFVLFGDRPGWCEKRLSRNTPK